MTKKAIIKKSYALGESLWIYSNNHLCQVINIDRTYAGREWCERKNMIITETITAENGETFSIYRKKDVLVSAIPA